MTAARPLREGVADLRRRLGSHRPYQRAVVLDGLAISTASVPEGAEVGIDLELESIANGLVAHGQLVVPWEGACRRCLEPVSGVATAEVREIFERHPTEGETYPLAEEVVDLEPMVRDAVLLALPLAPLCEEACPGPAPDAFPATVAGDADGGGGAGGEEAAGDEADRGRPPDPRWAALDELRFDEPEPPS